ncbi:P-loop containing nucleoside triphosphate hydrolase [Apiospora rasikravindrae]|uniref:P-loop containing nucleoside triphosphate hydrolase n=1 Tax=Apiospora rasikravindrae TaxID=990691 RepID=A0ABR1RM98_9PEZI
MRLLEVQGSCGVSLTEDLHHSTPPYAILSHTWEGDAQEVRLSDIRDQVARAKRGYRKIDFCQKQAAKDGLQYFWVDSCCINQDSEVELNRSINSMFRWYRDAEKCYVYLSDVTMERDDDSSTWDEAFRQSRWFTRGWTLQELIAPRTVEFFSSDGQYLGDKTSLEQQLHAITKIPVAALRGTTLSEFSLEERMSWSQYRETKLAEDRAYCLLGIFDIHMPLIYGEGQEHACRRLRKELEGNSFYAVLDMATDLRQEYRRQQPEPFSTVPFGRDPNFVDRPEILAWTRKTCNGSATRAALVGIGGVGKSQAAIEYAYRVRDDRPQTWVFWIHASTAPRVEEAYRGIAERLNLPGRSNPNANVCQLVNNWLCDEGNGRWVLILDNADDAEVFSPQRRLQDASTPLGSYLPQSRNGSILVTSRNRDAALRIVGDTRHVLQVQAMAKDQALQLLQNKLHTTANDDDMLDLLDALDCIPLAITQAAAYINRRSRTTVHSYLDEFCRSARRKGSLLDRDWGDLRRDSSASNTVNTTWRLSFESMRAESPSAADLLSLMSFFHSHGIPDWVLRKYKETALSTEEDTSDGDFDDDIDLLQSFSFVTVAGDDEAYEIHALVQFCTRAWLCSRYDDEAWARKFLSLMAKEFPTGDFPNRAKCQQLIPHLESLYAKEPPGKEEANEWARLLTHAAWYLWHEGNYNAAHDLAAKAFKAKEKSQEMLI